MSYVQCPATETPGRGDRCTPTFYPSVEIAVDKAAHAEREYHLPESCLQEGYAFVAANLGTPTNSWADVSAYLSTTNRKCYHVLSHKVSTQQGVRLAQLVLVPRPSLFIILLQVRAFLRNNWPAHLVKQANSPSPTASEPLLPWNVYVTAPCVAAPYDTGEKRCPVEDVAL